MRRGLWLVLLGLGALLAGGLREPRAWLVWAALLWGGSFVFPPEPSGLSRSGLWGLWVLWAFIASIGGLEPATSLASLARLAGTVWFFGLALAWWWEGDRRRWLLFLWVAAAVVGLAWAVDARFRLSAGAMIGQAAGLLPPNRNYTGAVLGCAASAACWAAASGRFPKSDTAGARLPAGEAAFLLVFAVACLAGVLGTESRGALAAWLGALFVWALLRRSPRLLLVLALAAAAGLALLPSAWLSDKILKLHDPYAYSRPHIWATALRAAARHPLTGVGPGLFERAYFLYREPLAAWGRFGRFATHAHSEPLNILAEQGLVGLLLFAWAILPVLPVRPADSWAREGAAGAAWALLLHSSIDGILSLPGLAVLLAGSLAAADGRPPTGVGAPRMRVWAAAGLLLTATGWISAQLPEGWIQASHSARTANEAARLLRAAADFHPADAFLREDLARAELLSSPSQPARALGELDRAVEANPGGALLWAQKAEIFYHTGDPAQAKACLEEAVRAEPNFVGAHLLLAEASLALGDADSARAELRTIALIRASYSKRLGGPPLPTYDAFLVDTDFKRLSAVEARLGRP